MHDEEFLDQYFEICRRIHEQRLREGTWPWSDQDSPISEDLVESEGNPKKI